MVSQGKRQVNVRVPEESYKELRVLAAKKDVTITFLIEQAIDDILEKEKGVIYLVNKNNAMELGMIKTSHALTPGEAVDMLGVEDRLEPKNGNEPEILWKDLELYAENEWTHIKEVVKGLKKVREYLYKNGLLSEDAEKLLNKYQLNILDGYPIKDYQLIDLIMLTDRKLRLAKIKKLMEE